MLTTDLGCGISDKMTCQYAYGLYRQCYNKQESEFNLDVFCDRFSFLQKNKLKNHGLTSLMDIQMTNNYKKTELHIIDRKIAKQAIDCQSTICGYTDPLAPLEQIYNSVSLIEADLSTNVMNQQQCGMCWAFGTVAALENAMMHNKSNIPLFWQQQQINLSQLFVGVNTYGSNDYCDGGNFFYAINYIAEHAQTVELQTNFEYTMANIAYYQPKFDIKQPIPPKIAQNNYFLPFQQFQEGSGVESPLIGLHLSNYVSFNTSTIQRIKSYLSRGIAVVGGMYVSLNEYKFATYTGGLLEAECNVYNSDHQVVIVGYGKYKGTDVWMFKNSHGTEWGAKGYFYIPIGSNSFCSEHVASVIIPLGLESDQIYSNIGDQTRGEWWQMDKDSNILVNNTGLFSGVIVNYTILIICGIAVVAIVMIIAVVLMCRKQYHKKGQIKELKQQRQIMQ
uniref:Cathepsin L n=1 Tax=Trepomonas sp. PC1 TaxID=1076344 RepID=A0A146K6N4_9EUKA|eukprot:JAP91584.1 Cathepsin L [Trepomonas sp. PC1]